MLKFLFMLSFLVQHFAIAQDDRASSNAPQINNVFTKFYGTYVPDGPGQIVLKPEVAEKCYLEGFLNLNSVVINQEQIFGWNYQIVTLAYTPKNGEDTVKNHSIELLEDSGTVHENYENRFPWIAYSFIFGDEKSANFESRLYFMDRNVKRTQSTKISTEDFKTFKLTLGIDVLSKIDGQYESSSCTYQVDLKKI